MNNEKTELEEYQDWVESTTSKNGKDAGISWCALGLAAEAGEVAGEVEKAIRKDRLLTPEFREKMADELGDVLWNVAATCNALDIFMDDVIMRNIQKINSRKLDGTHGY